MISPGRRSGGKMRGGSPAFSITSAAQVRPRTSSSDVVEALVISAPGTPVSQYASRSGISSTLAACATMGVAASWSIVVNGSCWMPVTAYSSAAGSTACTRGGTPAVRASR